MSLHRLNRKGRRFGIGDYSGGGMIDIISGLISQWKWNGNGIDNISAYNATLVNSPTFTNGSNGAPNGAIVVDGGATYAYSDDAAINSWSACSVSFWFYVISIPQIYSRLVEKGNNNEITIATGYGNTGNNYITLQQLAGTFGLINSAPYTLNAWHHCVVTIGPNATNNVSLYLDTVQQQATSNQPASKANTLYFSHGGGSNGYNGYMDDARWYNRVLSPSEVLILYNNKGF